MGVKIGLLPTINFIAEIRALPRKKLVGRRILKLISQHHSTLSTHLALGFPSVATRILNRKLSLLAKVSSEEESVGSKIFIGLQNKNEHSVKITQECKSLEEKIGCSGLTNSLVAGDVSLKKVKKEIATEN